MFNHYTDLLRHYRKTLVLGALVAGILTLTLSLVAQKIMPIYEATVTLNMQPSEEELRFNSGFMGVSQFNPATIIVQTHIERLLSQQVANRALDILIEESGGVLTVEPPTAFDKFKAEFRRWYNILNYGYFVVPPQRDAFVTDLINATEVEYVEGSYILLVAVSHDNPALAARAANALAQAYVDQTRAEFQTEAAQVDAALKQAVATREANLAKLQDERQGLARGMGVWNIQSERTIMLDTRAQARAALQDAQVELALLGTRESSLKTAILSQSDADVVRQLRQSLAEIIASRAALEERLKLRENAVLEADESLRSLEAAEETLDAIDLRISAVDSDLEKLRDRQVSTSLAREAQLSQIRTVNAARPPTYPKFPKVLLNTIVGTILGGVLIFLPILAMDVLGDRVRTSEDLRQSFGARMLPTVTPRLVRDSRRFNARGGRPSPRLFRYAQIAGRRLLPHADPSWLSGALFVTSFDAFDDVSGLREVIDAVLQIIVQVEENQAKPEAVALLPISQNRNWGKLQGHLIIVGLRPGTVDRTELADFGDSVRSTDVVPYAVMLP